VANYRVIDKQNWPRKDHFDFYRGFANPSFNLCVPVEAQRLYECAKDRGVSFFQLALYALVRAANDVPQLKQRLLDDDIIEYDQLAVMTPVMTAQEGFRQVWCDNAADFAAFSLPPRRTLKRRNIPRRRRLSSTARISSAPAACRGCISAPSLTRSITSARRCPPSPGAS
jgi:chloramphenicol O-acetyltransferase